MEIEHLKAYELVEKHESADIKSMVYELRHKKTGARVAVIENHDDNKVFYIGFRTPPKDSTGVAHIIEHSVLCGSEAFPLKDPFVELVKSSLNTFLNAMTYPDKTVYPVASCNEQDFKNLMHVYLDAVFHPNIYKEEKIFRQEGWHYEMESPESDLKINGVVYNEMKGAFSSPDDVLGRETFSSLFPDTAYGVESGGDPEVIPELTYENFLDFHRRYYHPSNSYIYLYGNADMAERLTWLDEHYLSAYEKLEIDSFPGRQKPFDGKKYITKEYPISEEESEEGNTYLTYNMIIGDALDEKLSLAMEMIDYSIISAEGTPLWKALTEAEIGTEIYASYDNGIYQPTYSIVAKNADPEDEERFVQVIEESLKKIIAEGIDENALLACVNSNEFRFREADMGNYPKGLIYGLSCFNTWLYEGSPFTPLEPLSTYAELREAIGSSYFTDILQKYVLDNPTKTVLKLIPKKGLTSKKDAQLAAKLAARKAAMTPEEIDEVIRKSAELKEYQSTPDPKEAYDCLPVLKREDLRKECRPYIYEWTQIDGAKALFHEVNTNGILYLNLIFTMKDFPISLMPYANILSIVLEAMDTEHYGYEQLGYEFDKVTGSFSASLADFIPDQDYKNYYNYFSVKMSVLKDSLPAAMELLREVVCSTKLEDTERLKEILFEARSRMQAGMISSGHGTAANHAAAGLTERDAVKELASGLGFYYFLDDLEKHYDEKKEELAAGLQKAAKLIFQRRNLVVDVTASKEEFKALNGLVSQALGSLPEAVESEGRGSLVPVKKKEGLTTSSQVQFVARAGLYNCRGFEYTGAFRVLKTILGYEYHWLQVRVQGGAYGCMNQYSIPGMAYFVSYRDPNLRRTNEIFEKTPEFIRQFTADEDQMTKYIIGTLSGMDTPLTPRTQGSRSLVAAMENITEEYSQKLRDQVLNATQEDIRALAEPVEAFLANESLCVIGNADKIREEKDLFDEVRPLFV